MTAISIAGAASHGDVDWHAIDWPKVHTTVRRLQARIVQATKAGRWGKVKALQRLLTHSFSGKALAVKRVTENPGKRTPGVDGQTWGFLLNASKRTIVAAQQSKQPKVPVSEGVHFKNGPSIGLKICLRMAFSHRYRPFQTGIPWPREDGASL